MDDLHPLHKNHPLLSTSITFAGLPSLILSLTIPYELNRRFAEIIALAIKQAIGDKTGGEIQYFSSQSILNGLKISTNFRRSDKFLASFDTTYENFTIYSRNLDLRPELDLISFVRLSESDKFLQEEISNCGNSQKLEKVLKKHECQFTIQEIASASRDLAASYWPWSQKDRQQRKDFFIRE